jgi:RNA polymerase sigma factor (sigma-70 family)
MNFVKELPPASVKPGRLPTRMDLRDPDSLATRASLLERLKDLDDQAGWQEFYSTYRKLIFSFALKHDLTPIEAEEVVQETVITVARNLPQFRYDPAQCAFKTWLFNLTRWRIQDQLRKRHPQDTSIHRPPDETDGTSTIERLPAPETDPATALWDAEWKQDLMTRALERLKLFVPGKSFQIFDLYGLQGWSAREVARSLGVSLTRVYVTKHRLAALLKKEILRLQKEQG